MNSIFRARTVFSTVLFTILLMGAFASSMAQYALSKESRIYPLTFQTNGQIDGKKDSVQWYKLKKYKLWATGEGENSVAISLESEDHFRDSLGYTGSAKGNLVFLNDKHTLWGPILVAGDFRESTGSDLIKTDFAHFGGHFYVGQNVGNNVYSGVFCADKGFDNDFQGRGGTIDCGNSRELDTDLDVPVLANKAEYNANIERIFANETGKDVYIDVPPEAADCSEGSKGENCGPYIIHVGSIYLENNANLFVRMSYEGRSTRIVVDSIMKLSNNSQIRVIYADNNETEWDKRNLKWTTTFNPKEDTIYTGELLIYTPKSIEFNAGDHQELNEKDLFKVFHGTYISGNEIKIHQGMSFNGQLLAKKIIVDHKFLGDFTFTPHDTKISTVNANGKLFKEKNGEKQQLEFFLNTESANKVTFKYCISFSENANAKQTKTGVNDTTSAHSDDFSPNSIPLCSENRSKTISFNERSKVPNEQPLFEIPLDGIVENVEYFYFRIFDVAGAVLSNGEITDILKLYIEDGDELPPSNEDGKTKIEVNGSDSLGYEDIEFAIDSFPVFFVDFDELGNVKGKSPASNYTVIIKSLPNDILKFDGKDATINQKISYSDLKKGLLKYHNSLNNYGDPEDDFVYDSLKFAVVIGDEESKETTLRIRIAPVNDSVKIVHLDASSYSDKNIVKKDTLKVDEDAAVGAVVGHAWALDTADANHHDKLDTVKYTFEKSKTTLKANEKDITEAFEIDRLTGDITVKKALDFETIHTYKGRVIATDNGVPGNRSAVLADTFDFVIELNDVDEEIETHDSTIHTMTITGVSGKDTLIGYEDVTFPVLNSFFPAYKTARIVTKEKDGQKTDEQDTIYETSITDFRVVVEAPSKGSLTYFGHKVTEKDTIPSDSLKAGMLKYTSELNEFGDSTQKFEKYASFKFRLFYKDKSMPSKTKTMFVDMTPVNDAPEIVYLNVGKPDVSKTDKNIIKNNTFSVEDDVVAGSVIGYAFAIDTADSKHNSPTTLKYSLGKSLETLKGGEKQVTDAFEINEMTGAITVKAGAALDYDKDSVYHGQVFVTDNGVPGTRDTNFLKDSVALHIVLAKGPAKTDSITVRDTIIVGEDGKKEYRGYEDIEFPIDSFPAFRRVVIVSKKDDSGEISRDTTVKNIENYSVKIESVSKGSLMYKGKKVDLTNPLVVSSEDVKAGLLTFKGLQDEFGDSAKGFIYAELKFSILRDGAKKYSETKTMKIVVKPMNDKPVVANTTLRVSDSSKVNTVAGGVTAQDDVDSKFDAADKLTYKIIPAEKLEKNEKDFSEAFEIDSATGEIKVMKTLDYYRDSLYVGRVVVTDSGVPGDRNAARFLKDTADVIVKLVLGDSTPVSLDTTVVSGFVGNAGKMDTIGYEDVAFSITHFPAYEYFRIDTMIVDKKIEKVDTTVVILKDYKVKVVELPKGELTLDGKAVKVDDEISSTDLKKGLLKYKGLQDEFGDSAKAYVYAELKFSILRDGGKDYSETKTMKIVVKPMNDKPEVQETVLKVSDISPVNTEFGPVKASDKADSQYDAVDVLTYEIIPAAKLEKNEKAISDAFEIDPKTGKIKLVKKLNYREDSLYVGRVVVTDNGVPGDRDAARFLKDTADVVVKVVLGDSTPVARDSTVFSDTIANGGVKDTIGYEDVAFSITHFPAYEYFKFDTTKINGKITKIDSIPMNRLEDYGVMITKLPKGVLNYGGKKVNVGDTISSDDLKKGLLTYKGRPNEFGDSAKSFMYDTLSFQILYDNHISVPQKMNIQMKPVNDKPEIMTKSLTVKDSLPKGSVAGKVTAQDSVDMNRDAKDSLKFKFEVMKDLKADETDIMTAFEIDEKTGEIKTTKALDYYRDSLYRGYVIVTDNGVPGDREHTLSDKVEFTLKLTRVKKKVVTHDTICVHGYFDNGSKKDTVGYEDVAFSITKFPAYEYFRIDTTKIDGKITKIDTVAIPLEDYNVKIVELPKGSLTLDGKAVKAGDKIFSDDLKKGLLKYKGLPNDFGDSAKGFAYATLKFQIVDNDDLVSEIKSAKFVMLPVNDKPEVTKKNFTIAENVLVGAVAVTVVAQDFVDMSRDSKATLTYKFETVENLKAGEKDAMSVFEIDSKTGELKVKKVLDYYQDSVYHGVVIVTDNGVPGNRDSVMSDTANIYVKLTAVNRPPMIQNDTFHVAENSPAKTPVGKIIAHDREDADSILAISLVGSSDEFVVAKDGKITVKQGAVLDYETKREYTLKVNVKDSDGLTADGSIVILIDDVREPATLNDTIFHVPENVSKGHVVGVVVPNNPNKNTLKFKIVTDNDKFKIRDDGTIITNGDIDYEEQKVYKLKVVMNDDGNKDTATVTINVDNVEERSVVKITRADDGDTIWINPDTIYTNKYKIDFEWTLNGKLRPDSIVEYSKDGTYLFSVCETDPSMDLPGCDTAIVKIDNSIPKVRISKSAEDTSAITGVTIVEQVDKNDTNFYVNHEDNIVTVGITDKGMGVDSTFSMHLRLDTLKNTKESLDKIKKISKTEITLDDAEKSQTKRTVVNDDTYEVSFKKLVGDDMVTVTYYTDKNGNVVRDLDGNAFMKVTYETEVNGEPAKVSYNVDADNGKVIENENGGRYEYSYSYVDKFGGLVGVNYSLDEKGRFAKTDAGDLGYKVSYTYKNRYGNSATKNIRVVVDKIVPQVKILSPGDKYVSRVSGVDVKWTVDGEVQDTLVIQALKNGLNKVIRTYRDKAGNESSDTVDVYLKAPKELNVHVEKPVTIVSEDSVRKYYDDNPPEKGQSFAVSMYNPYADKEVETLIGGTFGKKKGEKKDVYSGMEGHLGPTLLIDALAPRCGDKTAGGLCTLDDLIERDGKISLEAGGGWDRKKVSVDEYVEQYCSDDFRKDYKNDPAKANLYNTRLRVTIWIYTNIGGFLDEYSFTQEVNDPDYVSEIGEVEIAFEMKPDMDGNVLSAKGRLLGTGAYIFNTEVKSVSELRCKLPSEEIGHKRVLTDTLRKPFGYKRPSLSKGKKK